MGALRTRRPCAVGKGVTNAANAAEPLVRNIYLFSTRDYILEKSLMNVVNVGNYLAINPTFFYTK